MSVEVNLMQGDCLETLKNLPDNSVDSIVTDPPYGLSFMGKKWDYDVPSQAIWEECLRVLKPGGYLLAFAGTRTQHRMAVRIEDAGFEIRDMIAWVYGSGFPKSLDVSKAIDKAAGVEREVLGVAGKSGSVRNSMAGDFAGGEYMATAPATEAAKQWEGWGTALKPALEPITVARKPLSEKTVAQNVLVHGTGGINIDGCRVQFADENDLRQQYNNFKGHGTQNHSAKSTFTSIKDHDSNVVNVKSRFPANFIHDGSEEVTDLLGDSARFFYCAKTSKKDRDEGLSHLEDKKTVTANYGFNDQEGIAARGRNPENHNHYAKNIHPTVKPTDLMRYLCRLVTPPNGTVLDPFMGSGSTGKAAVSEGFNFIGCELSPEYMEIAKARIEHAQGKNDHQVKEHIEDKVDDSKKRKTLFD